LTSIGGYLSIEGNDTLTSLSGLDNINASSISDLLINDNVSLSSCAVQSICDYLKNSNGFTSIHGNAPGCNSQAEVKIACWIVNIEEGQTIQNQFTFYPNPVTSNAKLSGQFSHSGKVNISICNTTGICQKTWQFANQKSEQQEFTLNLNGLPTGIYILRLQVGSEVVTKKVVKL